MTDFHTSEAHWPTARMIPTGDAFEPSCGLPGCECIPTGSQPISAHRPDAVALAADLIARKDGAA